MRVVCNPKGYGPTERFAKHENKRFDPGEITGVGAYESPASTKG